MCAKANRRKPTVSAPLGSADSSSLGDLQSEIQLLRQAIQNVRVRAEDGSEISLEDLLKVLDVLSRSAARLAQVLEAQRSLESAGGVAAELSAALEAALREYNLL